MLFESCKFGAKWSVLELGSVFSHSLSCPSVICFDVRCESALCGRCPIQGQSISFAISPPNNLRSMPITSNAIHHKRYQTLSGRNFELSASQIEQSRVPPPTTTLILSKAIADSALSQGNPCRARRKGLLLEDCEAETALESRWPRSRPYAPV